MLGQLVQANSQVTSLNKEKTKDKDQISKLSSRITYFENSIKTANEQQ